MEAGTPAEKRMIAYLLGDLSEVDRANFERDCLVNDRFFEELLAIEAELTDDYVRGELVGVQREAFEQRLLNSPERAKDVTFAKLITRPGFPQSRTLASKVPTKTSRPWSPFAWFSAPGQFPRIPLAVAAILVIGLSTGLFLWKKQSSPRPQERGQASQATDQTKPPTEQGPAQPIVIATFVLTAGGERDAGSLNEIKVPPGTDRVRLRVDLAASHYHGYDASLRRVGGQTLLNLSDLKASSAATGNALIIELPARTLPSGDSILTVRGLRNSTTRNVVGRYFLRRVQ